MSFKLYTPYNWYDIDRLAPDDVQYHKTRDLLVDYNSYAKLQAENEALKAELYEYTLRVTFKNSELSYLYGQDRVPKSYKQRIKAAIDI